MKFMMDTTTFSKVQQNGETTMTKKEYYQLLNQEKLVTKIETTTNDADTFHEKMYKASGGSEDKLFKYECTLTDEELDRVIQLKQLARLNTIAHIMIFFVVLCIIVAILSFFK